jgi:starch synthase
MRIAYATAELAPYAHVGGLGDVSRWLPRALAAAGDEVCVFLPFYDVLDAGELPVHQVVSGVDIGELGTVGVYTLGDPGPDLPWVYLIDSPDYFHRGAIYAAVPDEHLVFGVLTASVAAVCDAMGWVPDVIHANDWHTSLIVPYLRAAGDYWSSKPTVLTIHNLAFQGVFPAVDLRQLGLAEQADIFPGEDLVAGRVNSLKTGIATATIITTVSPGYAREILTPLRGMGLDEVLRSRRGDLVGILSGIGDEWDPETDPWIPRNYGHYSLAGKAENTGELRRRLGLDDRPGVPVFGVVSRLTEQKGFELLRGTLPPLLSSGRIQLAAIGTGETRYETLFRSLQDRYPGAAGYVDKFSPEMAHLVEAGAHLFLMPSKFEPCGLTQMYSMKYGTVPVVHQTGGLADSVEAWNPDTGTGSGFLFSPHTEEALASAIDAALAAFADREAWHHIVYNGMTGDYSWQRRAQEYRAVYARAEEAAAQPGRSADQ